MNVDAWHLPWGRETVSHGILDINRGCNITCRACYNTRPPSCKSLEEIAAELIELKKRRKLAYVSLVGGEVLLHPNLIDIIRYLKSDGLCVQLFTNGLLLDDRCLSELSRTGLDIIYIHIDRGQTRSDLPDNPTNDQLRELWDEKAGMIARHGIDVGLTMTAYTGELDDVRNIVEYMSDSPHVNYLLVTLFRDTDNITGLHGNIDTGMTGSQVSTGHPLNDTLTNREMIDFLQDELHMRPFAYLGSNKDRNDPRWLSYMVAARRDREGRMLRHSMKASTFEKIFCALSLKLAGKYPMYQRQSAFQLVAQLLLNGFCGGDILGNIGFLVKSFRPGIRLRAKRILFQCPAQIEADCTLTHCLNCPDAVVKNGGLVPLCISDRVESDSNTKEAASATK